MTDSDPQNAEPIRKKRSITTIGDFELKKKLGKGGMGEVYLARQMSLDRVVALKTLSKELAKKKDFVGRFNREVKTMARLDHPGIVKVYAVDEYKGIHFAAIEYVDGESVQAWLNKLQRFSVGDAVHIAMVSAEALKHAHDLNLVHRDVKPDNILLTSRGVVKVADFGLAKLVDEDVSMTQSGTALGTPLYMAPEQARSAKTVDQRSDIYALGATLYHMLTGVPPLQGDNALELILAKESGKYESARKLRPEIPEKLDLILDKMMARESKHRYPACDELLRDLASLNVHNTALSFIDGAQTAELARPPAQNTATTNTGQTTSRPLSLPPPPKLDVSSREDARNQELSKSHSELVPKQKKPSRTWFVQFQDPHGNTVVEKMTTGRILKMIHSDRINAKARAKFSSEGAYVPLAEFPEFKEEIENQLSRKSANIKQDDMKNLYKQVARQEQNRGKGRWLTNQFRGFMGFLSLLVWLAIIGVVGYFLFLGGSQLFRWLGEKVTELMK